MRFVVRVKFLAEGGPGRIHCGDDIRRLHFGEEFEQRACKPEDSVGGFTRDRTRQARSDGIICPEYLGVRVKNV